MLCTFLIFYFCAASHGVIKNDYSIIHGCCRSVGRPIGNQYGVGTGPILLDNLACNGNEDSLFDCGHGGVGVHNCGHGEDISISCN